MEEKKMNEKYIYSVTEKELNLILKQQNIKYDLIKNGDDPDKWYYQVYYYDALKHLIAISKYKYIIE